MSREIGLPDKVIEYALQRGAHNDCIVADYDRACSDCVILVITGLDLIYGAVHTSSAVVDAIAADLMAEA